MNAGPRDFSDSHSSIQRENLLKKKKVSISNIRIPIPEFLISKQVTSDLAIDPETIAHQFAEGIAVLIHKGGSKVSFNTNSVWCRPISVVRTIDLK